MLKEEFKWYWIGLYLVHEEKLVLGPFQGPPACPIIFKGQGVCGSCWAQNKTIIVEDVNKFEGHIACSTKSKS
jgi:L-methionine (R)-S-oxide reductase